MKIIFDSEEEEVKFLLNHCPAYRPLGSCKLTHNAIHNINICRECWKKYNCEMEIKGEVEVKTCLI